MEGFVHYGKSLPLPTLEKETTEKVRVIDEELSRDRGYASCNQITLP